MDATGVFNIHWVVHAAQDAIVTTRIIFLLGDHLNLEFNTGILGGGDNPKYTPFNIASENRSGPERKESTLPTLIFKGRSVILPGG